MKYSSFNQKVISFIKLSNEISTNYFPEMLYKMFIVNAPSIFSVIWSGLKKCLDEKI
jgi:hypothetical protein